MQAYKSMIQPRKEPTDTQKIMSHIFLIILGTAIIAVFQVFLNILFRPFHIESDEERDEAYGEKCDERDSRLRMIAEDVNDPMYQFYDRFIENPDKWKNDPDNDVYKKWYEDWKSGKILDTTMRWAPKCTEDEGETLCPNFIQYMKIQWALHVKASFWNRINFLRTVFKCYPELTPTFKGMEQDLVGYESDARKDNLENELKAECEKIGLCEDLSDYLLDQKVSSTKFQNMTATLKKYSEMGYEPETCICAVENKITDPRELDTINRVMTDRHLPVWIGLALVKGDMTEKEVARLEDLINSYKEELGDSIYYPSEEYETSLFHHYCTDALRHFKAEKRLKKFA